MYIYCISTKVITHMKIYFKGGVHDVVANVLVCDIIVCEFEH